MEWARIALYVVLLLTMACREPPEAVQALACEDVERALLGRVRSAIRSQHLSDVPLDQLSVSLSDTADGRYIAIEVRAPNGRHFSYRLERETGQLYAADLSLLDE